MLRIHYSLMKMAQTTKFHEHNHLRLGLSTRIKIPNLVGEYVPQNMYLLKWKKFIYQLGLLQTLILPTLAVLSNVF